jgi:hypothetical protein
MTSVLRIVPVFLTLSLFLSPATAEDLDARERAASEVTMAFLQQLGGALKEEMGAKGPAAAIRVCRDVAPTLAGELSRQNGWRVTRVGTRVRNPLLGTPDAWEQGVLAEFARRAEAGEPLKTMAHSELVEEPGARYFRFMKAIGIQPLCLTCHGEPSQIPEAVRTVLKSEYPTDEAVGYTAGELRGAVSIKQPIDRPLRSTD